MLLFISLFDINAKATNKKTIDELYSMIDSSQIEISNNTNTIKKISKDIETICYLYDKQSELIGKEQSTIENSLNATTLRLDIFAILLTIAGIVLGVYINRKESKIQEILRQVKDAEQEMSRSKSEMLNLNETINSDIASIYERLKREETTTYLKRLVYEPNDIVNLVTLLVSRELYINDFKYLLVAYKKFKENSVDDEYSIRLRSLYLIVFYQHFCGQSIMHDLVRQDLIDYFIYVMDSAFKKDICNSTHSLINCLNKEATYIDRVDIVYKYLVAILSSKFKIYDEPYKIIVFTLRYDYELKMIWDKLVENKYVSEILGNLLCERLSDDEVFVNSVKNLLKSITLNKKSN